MRLSKPWLLGLSLIAVAALLYFLLPSSTPAEQAEILTSVRRGDFVIRVTATGELQAKRSEKIRGPQGMRTAQIYQTTISDLVPEGTVVQAGEYVARLDKTELDTKMKEALNEIEKINTQLEAAKIDTAIELRGIRDELINLRFGMREKQLEVEQSRYEAPMVIQQAEIALEKAERDYNQLQQKYRLSQEKAQAQIAEILASLKTYQLRLQNLQELAGSFVIMAPKDGMVIYARSWNGKVGPGSQISTWDPVVAELPDLTDMVSKTYVNEVDISRVKKGQDVKIQVDAFPENSYTGRVIKVANIGEQLRNYDSKVFEVTVQVFENDSILRPAMTTSNEIITDVLSDKIFIPLEALQKDSLTFVYKLDNGKPVRQEVMTSWTNDSEIVINHGLTENDQVYLTIPPDADKLPLVRVDPAVRQQLEKQLAAERAEREALMQEKMKAVPDEHLPEETGGGGIIIIN